MIFSNIYFIIITSLWWVASGYFWHYTPKDTPKLETDKWHRLSWIMITVFGASQFPINALLGIKSHLFMILSFPLTALMYWCYMEGLEGFMYLTRHKLNKGVYKQGFESDGSNTSQSTVDIKEPFVNTWTFRWEASVSAILIQILLIWFVYR